MQICLQHTRKVTNHSKRDILDDSVQVNNWMKGVLWYLVPSIKVYKVYKKGLQLRSALRLLACSHSEISS